MATLPFRCLMWLTLWTMWAVVMFTLYTKYDNYPRKQRIPPPMFDRLDADHAHAQDEASEDMTEELLDDIVVPSDALPDYAGDVVETGSEAVETYPAPDSDMTLVEDKYPDSSREVYGPLGVDDLGADQKIPYNLDPAGYLSREGHQPYHGRLGDDEVKPAVEEPAVQPVQALAKVEPEGEPAHATIDTEPARDILETLEQRTAQLDPRRRFGSWEEEFAAGHDHADTDGAELSSVDHIQREVEELPGDVESVPSDIQTAEMVVSDQDPRKLLLHPAAEQAPVAAQAESLADQSPESQIPQQTESNLAPVQEPVQQLPVLPQVPEAESPSASAQAQVVESFQAPAAAPAEALAPQEPTGIVEGQLDDSSQVVGAAESVEAAPAAETEQAQGLELEQAASAAKAGVFEEAQPVQPMQQAPVGVLEPSESQDSAADEDDGSPPLEEYREDQGRYPTKQVLKATRGRLGPIKKEAKKPKPPHAGKISHGKTNKAHHPVHHKPSGHGKQHSGKH